MKPSTIAYGVALVIMVALLVRYSSSPRSAPVFQQDAIPLGSQEISVPANGYFAIPFAVTSEPRTRRWVVGHFRASGGSGNDVGVYVVGEDGLTNLRNHHPFRSYYSARQETAGELDVGPLLPGSYYLVYDNSFSLFTSKSVENGVMLQASPGR